MPSVSVSELSVRTKWIRLCLLISFLPICFLMLFCAIYSTYLTIETWDCRLFTNAITIDKNDSTSGPTDVKCFTIIDSFSGQLSKYITERKILLIVRTVSIINTFSTYISAWVAIYKLSLLPMLWLAIVSIASFFITLNASIIFGPLTGINNFELVPIFIGIDLNPLLVTSVVLVIDLLIAIVAIFLVLNSYKKRT